VDIFGQPANYRALLDMAERYDLWIISDAAQSMGGVSQGASVGAHAEIVTTSFFPAKPLGGYGDGGAVFLNGNAVSLAEEVLSLRFHGKGQSKYHHVRVGRNSRLDTIQAAILLEKLKIFPQEIEARNRIADRYHQGLKNHVITPSVLEGTQSSWAQYTIRLPEHVDRACMVEQLKVAGIPTMIYYETPVHQQPAYSHFPCASATGYLTVCEQLSRRVLSLPMHPYLTEAQQDKIITEVCACV
jgi:dTDP-4-amino-4,6-dideoxygalactose transaminase